MGIEIESKVFSRTSLLEHNPMMEVYLDAGYTLTGGGAWIDYEEPGNLLVETYPLQIRGGIWSGWRAQAKDVWVSSKATITVYAIGIKVTKDGEVLPVEQTVFASETAKADLPKSHEQEGWVAVGGGVKCQQNIFENVSISESAPLREEAGTESHQKISSWYATKQFCFSPTSDRGPTGGGELSTYLIAIRAEGVDFKTRIFSEKSEELCRPVSEVVAKEGVVVSGGAVDKQLDMSFTDFAGHTVNMLTATYPLYDPSAPERIKGWKAAGKDHHFKSPSKIRVYCVTLEAEPK